ncbi:MAG: hypothetical protein KA140_04460 [Caldisericia bacterium]|nr:hypothetical protein [Caldisericia bacterium]
MPQIRNDEPINSVINDLFGFSFQASMIAKLVGGKDSQNHLSVGVSGSWGSGKTSLLNMVREFLKYKQHNDEKEKLEKILFSRTYCHMSEARRSEIDQRIIYLWAFFMKLEQENIELEDFITDENKVIWFDPWFFGSEETVIKAFFYRIAKELVDEDRELSKLFLKLAVVMVGSPDLPESSSLPVVGDALKIINFGRNLINRMSGDDGSIMDFSDIKRKICERLKTNEFTYVDDEDDIKKKTRKRIVIIIDDLDRLQVDEALTMLKVIRLVTEFGVNFVIGYDEETLSATIDKNCGSHGREYIRKMVSIPWYVSYWKSTDMISRIFIHYKETDIYNQISREMDDRELNIANLNELLEVIVKTPREALNLINLLKIVTNQVNMVDYLLLCLLRIYYPRMFDKMKEREWPFMHSLNTNRLSFIHNQDKFEPGESKTETKTEHVPDPRSLGTISNQLQRVAVTKESNTTTTKTNKYKLDYLFLVGSERDDIIITRIIEILEKNTSYDSIMNFNSWKYYFGLLNC